MFRIKFNAKVSNRALSWIVISASIQLYIHLVIAMFTNSAFAQTDTLEHPVYFQATIDELLEHTNKKLQEESVSIATQTVVPVRETPAIVTVITREEIQNSGARDLLDLLRMVPGLDFGVDVNNVIGIGVRGNWALEGKVLITIDGQMMNETSYGSYSFGHHLLLGSIQKVEIIRGPGSAIYGGVAGLAVINIITRDPKDIQGIQTSSEIAFAGGRSRYNTQFDMGKTLENGLAWHVNGFISEANLSNKMITTPNGTNINYKDSSLIKSYYLITGLQYKNLDIHYIYEDYKSDFVEHIGQVVFGGHYLDAKYDWQINPKLTIIPQANLKIQYPWNLQGIPDFYDNTINQRYTGSIKSIYDPGKRLNLISGIEYYYDLSKYLDNDINAMFNNGQPYLSFSNIALHNQVVLRNKFANLTAGLRVDIHSAYGAALAPRLGITRIYNKWHLKLLYSDAFKAPTILNINANAQLKPERLKVAEFEVGYQISPNHAITANLYNITIDNTIVYLDINNLGDNYVNSGRSGSIGGEISYNLKQKWGYLKANYSLYQATHDQVEDYNVAGNKHIKLGFPAQKLVCQANIKLTPQLSINPSLVLFSKKYTYTYNKNEEFELISIAPTLLSDVYINYKRFLFKDLQLGLGCYNIFNANYQYVQPYAGHENPVPTQGREVSVKLTFAIN